MPEKALYLLIVRQQFTELCELLRSVTASGALPDILNYLLSRPAETQQTQFSMTSFAKQCSFQVKVQLPKRNEHNQLRFCNDRTIKEAYPVLISPSVTEGGSVDATLAMQSSISTGQIKCRHAQTTAEGQRGERAETEMTGCLISVFLSASDTSVLHFSSFPISLSPSPTTAHHRH